jgi:bifunctional DNA-binding transcriptional regulator/antitoxin component of YhaV-PrlF toxin-antitoxin module
VFLAVKNMKIKVDNHCRIIIPPEIRSSYSDNFAYFGISLDKTCLEIVPSVYVRAIAEEYERIHGKHTMSNKHIRAIYRKFFSGIYYAKVAQNHRVVIPPQVRKTFEVAPNKELEVRVMGQRLIIGQVSQ